MRSVTFFINILLCYLAVSEAQTWKGKAPKNTATTSTTTKAKTTTAKTKTTATTTKVVTASQSKLLYASNSCPMTLCSGTKISKSQLTNYQGSFKAVTATDVALAHPAWAIKEIKALQGGNWPANTASKSCFEMKCPTITEIRAVISKSTGKDAIAIATSNPTMNLGRIQTEMNSVSNSDGDEL